MIYSYLDYNMLLTPFDLENKRVELQEELDSYKTQFERNRLGQFATPSDLAFDILKYGLKIFPETKDVHFLDPAVGTGAFFSALLRVFPKNRIAHAMGFEIDSHYANSASHLWAESGLTVQLADFTIQNPSSQFNLIICNPPYVRHHYLSMEDKIRLQFLNTKTSGMKLSGLAGLYCYFLGLSHPWLVDDGIAGWLIPSEFMDVNYGKAVRRYLLEKVTLLHIHRFDPNEVQFQDAIVSSSIVWFKKSPPPQNHTVQFSFGGSLFEPNMRRDIPAEILQHEEKWSRFPILNSRINQSTPVLSNFFKIQRGLATGDNNFFILPKGKIISRNLPLEVFRPILPSPRYLDGNEIEAKANGLPKLDRELFLLDTRFSEEKIKELYPELYIYLAEGKTQGIHERYLCRHRKPWYSQENRLPAPIIFTYFGRNDSKRGRPFRFILNNSIATVANVYLALYPKPFLRQKFEKEPSLLRQIWEELNKIDISQLLCEGRVYGGGLHKLEPLELANVDGSSIGEIIQYRKNEVDPNQLMLF